MEDALFDPLFDCVKGKLLCKEAESSGEEDEEEGPPTEETKLPGESSLNDHERTSLVKSQPIKTSLNAVEDDDVASNQRDQERNPYDDDDDAEAPKELDVHTWTDQYQERVKIIKM